MNGHNKCHYLCYLPGAVQESRIMAPLSFVYSNNTSEDEICSQALSLYFASQRYVRSVSAKSNTLIVGESTNPYEETLQSKI